MDGLRGGEVSVDMARKMTPEQARAVLRVTGHIAPCDIKPLPVFVRLALAEWRFHAVLR